MFCFITAYFVNTAHKKNNKSMFAHDDESSKQFKTRNHFIANITFIYCNIFDILWVIVSHANNANTKMKVGLEIWR